MLKFEHDNSQNQIKVLFSGRLDTDNSMIISEKITEKLNSIRPGTDVSLLIEEKIVFDLQEVTYIASMFIRVCLHTSRQLHSGNFCIINCDPFVKKTFKTAGLDDLINVT